MIEASSRIALVSGRGHKIYLPVAFAFDSTFPFKSGQRVRIRIDGKRLVVE